MQSFKNRNRKSGAFNGVCSRSELINQNETALVRLIIYINNICHVRRESRERLLNRLLVADIGKNLIKNRYFTSVGCGNHKTAHCHHRKQTERFNRNGFTARVRACYDKSIKIRAERDINGHNLFRVNKRMPCRTEIDNAPVVENRRCGFDFVGILRFCKNQIKLKSAFVAVFDAVCKISRLSRKLAENAVDFFTLFGLQNPDFVVGFNNRHRFDEYGCAACRGVMHKSGNFTAVFALDRNNISAVALSDDIFLKIF